MRQGSKNTPVNYQREMETVIAALPAQGPKPRLLLHACCAPCSSAVLERLEQSFQLTLVYYNPNIDPPAEYLRREVELERFVEQAGYADKGIDVVELPYEPAVYEAAVRGLEGEPERGARCTVCYRLRLERTARYAAEQGYAWFCTTLSVSPHKDPVRLNALGEELAAKYGVRWLPSAFRKKDGYKRSLALSEQYGLYRQDYCGCRFSRASRP